MSGVLAVVDDLFFGAKISETARHVGSPLTLVRAVDFYPARLYEPPPVLIIFDLNATSANPVELIRQLKQGKLAAVPVVGFLSHVQAELQQAAREAGCDQVLPRSKFSALLPELLQRYAQAGGAAS